MSDFYLTLRHIYSQYSTICVLFEKALREKSGDEKDKRETLTCRREYEKQCHHDIGEDEAISGRAQKMAVSAVKGLRARFLREI